MIFQTLRGSMEHCNIEKACPFSSRVRILVERQVKSRLYACNNCQEPLNGYL